ncbi:energy-coupling factor transport system ATP-binding protein [Methanomicrobium sp. W14]|uniref:tryptophan transporter n=1 Tax=Methanomicrobium sp. W14 TaxID=2817839 RepID=UPI001AE81B8C|nr:energy-coupling factor transport system ATP-binding protein [Methanomicrobium sp. W14]
MRSRDIAIVGILLAAGAILRYISNVVPGAIVVNPVIAFYCLAIILIAPKLRDALGIGIVAGILSALISHSVFPPANLISEPLGALVCLFFYSFLKEKVPLAPGVTTFVATLVSGFVFLFISIAVIVAGIIQQPFESFTVGLFFVTLSPLVIAAAVANSAITQILFIPSSKILARKNSPEKNAEEIVEKEEAKGKDEDKCVCTGPKTEVYDESVPAISFGSFSYTYPAGNVPALTDISLNIRRGECVLVNGATGAGKTTFCLAAAGIISHEYEGKKEGCIKLFGKDVSEYRDMGDIGSRIGVVFDDADAQLIFTTVEEEVLSGLENRGMSPSEVKGRLESIMRVTDIEKLRYRAPHTLSGGQKQRVSLAATLASGTKCLILDEATAELDTAATSVIISVLKKLKEEKKTIIVVEQKPREMAEIADRVILLENGKVVSDQAAEDYFRDYTADEDSFERSRKLHEEDVVISDVKPVVEIKDLVHDYGGHRGLDGVSLRIMPGELVAIIGENGSGKTTLSKHLNGLLKPTSGEVMVCGLSTADYPVTELARHAGLVFQNPDTMLFEDTAEREVLFGLKNIGKDPGEDKYVIPEILEEVGLCGKAKTFPRSMSRGERQRLAIACVIAMKPEIIILDEPTTGLDDEESERIMAILENLSRQGHTVIMVSHDMSIVKHHARRIITMSDGKITCDSKVSGGV